MIVSRSAPSCTPENLDFGISTEYLPPVDLQGTMPIVARVGAISWQTCMHVYWTLVCELGRSRKRRYLTRLHLQVQVQLNSRQLCRDALYITLQLDTRCGHLERHIVKALLQSGVACHGMLVVALCYMQAKLGSNSC